MNIQPEYEVEIKSLVNGGNGLGVLPTGKKIFIPYSLPGEILKIQIENDKKNFCFGSIKEVIKPSSLRIEPRCKHFGTCGGCNFQHMNYSDQLLIKENIIKEQLSRTIEISSVKFDSIIPSPLEWSYRNHVQFHPTPDGEMAYREAGSPNPVEISECHLLQKPIDQLWKQFSLEPESMISRISWRANEIEDVLLILEGSDPTPPEFNVDYPLNAVYMGDAGIVTLSGEPFLQYEINSQSYQVSAESFFQVNTGMVSKMVDTVLETVQPGNTATFLDVYCGVGLFSKFMAPYFNRVIGIEIVPSSIEDYVVNLKEHDNVSIYLGAAEDILPSLDITPDMILVDPPRNGVAKPALEKILSMQPDTIIYVSCDIASFCRDVKIILSAGYYIKQITPFDLFPQTYHVESIVLLERTR